MKLKKKGKRLSDSLLHSRKEKRKRGTLQSFAPVERRALDSKLGKRGKRKYDRLVDVFLKKSRFAGQAIGG